MSSHRKATEAGDAEAQFQLAMALSLGKDGEAEDRKEAAVWFEKAAKQGHAEAAYSMAICFLRGLGVPKDAAAGVAWYRKAADLGDKKAQYYYGACLAAGSGVKADEKASAEWYRKSAEQGFAPAQYQIGFCLQKGIGVPSDPVAAVEWYQKAMAGGVIDAESSLGDLYFEGRGVEQDRVAAVKLFRSAADKGDAFAMFMTGLCLHEAVGTQKNIEEGKEWYRRAAAKHQQYAKVAVDKGHGDAMLFFGDRWNKRIRRYVERDDAGLEIYEWSAAAGNEEAKQRVQEIQAKLQNLSSASFAERVGPVGVLVAETVKAFPLDIVSVVLSYVTWATARSRGKPIFLREFAPPIDRVGDGDKKALISSIAVSPSGHIIVCRGPVLHVFHASGEHSPTRFDYNCYCAAFDSNPRPDGALEHFFVTHDDRVSVHDHSRAAFRTFKGPRLSLPGNLRSIAVQSQNAPLVFVGDTIRSRVRVFAAEGKNKYMRKFKVGVAPERLALHNRDLFVASSASDTVQVFDSTTGKLVREVRLRNGQKPAGIAVDSVGNLLAVVPDRNILVAYRPDGAFLNEFGMPGADEGQFNTPVDVCVGADGLIYIADQGNARVQVLAFPMDRTIVRY